MKPTIIAILATLILASCTQYRYDVAYQKCDGSTGSYVYAGSELNSPSYFNSSYPPELAMLGKIIRNVCDFEYTKTEITQ